MGCRGGEDGPLAQLGPALEEVRLRVAERACELETSLELGDEALALQQQRDRVQGRDVWHAKHLKNNARLATKGPVVRTITPCGATVRGSRPYLLVLDVAEHGDLGLDRGLQVGLATAHHLCACAGCRARGVDDSGYGVEMPQGERNKTMGRTTSGERPRPRRSRTLACVGLVFCSPTLPTTGTSETCSCAPAMRTSEQERERVWHEAHE